MRVAVLGCGNMGRAIIHGLQKKYGSAVEIVAFDNDMKSFDQLDATVAKISPDQWFAGTKHPDCILVAVKPQDIANACKPVVARAPDVLWISIAAGVAIEKLITIIGSSARVCRVMPNTPALIGEGISAYSLSPNCKEGDAKLAESILSACGSVIQVPEKMLNAVTGLSGSGPAYVYLFIEALIEGGVTAGLPYAVARECAVQTVIGAGRMLAESSESPAQLKARVMSPGGTTAAGLKELEKNSFKYAIIEAIAAATHRAVELG
jgi:pyrroline-5-carboxylate reductase